jgi:hypothetical protein
MTGDCVNLKSLVGKSFSLSLHHIRSTFFQGRKFSKIGFDIVYSRFTGVFFHMMEKRWLGKRRRQKWGLGDSDCNLPRVASKSYSLLMAARFARACKTYP